MKTTKAELVQLPVRNWRGEMFAKGSARVVETACGWNVCVTMANGREKCVFSTSQSEKRAEMVCKSYNDIQY